MPQNPVHLALLFHCNQAISNFAQAAAEDCYRGLVRTLRRHPRARLNFHLSGSLLTSLQWWCPDLVEEIRGEIARGRWETLASTYAQNVPYTGPDDLNRLALGVHRGVLQAAFPESNPRGFWISERSWRPAMADIIAGAGLDYTLIEDHILRDAGCIDLDHPRRIRAAGRDLAVFTDNEDFKHPFNYAVWTGDFEPVLRYIRHVRERMSGGDIPPIITYAEDGEVCGLWPRERGCPPQIVWGHLDRLLSALEEEPGVKLTCLSSYLDRWGDQIPIETRRIGRGQAKWMCDSLADPHLPFHEDGYTDWFDFNRRADKLKRFRPHFAAASQEILSTRPRTPAQRRLHFQAALGIAAHTFEFGCIGIGHRRGQLWERHRVAALPLALANGGAPKSSGAVDLNGDGRREHALVTREMLSLWSRRTGALLHLFDRPTGDEIVGNELASQSIFGLGHDDEIIPEIKPPQPRWSGFRSARQSLEDFDGLWREVPRSRAWMRYLIDWSELGAKPGRIRQVTIDRDNPWVLENGSREMAGYPWPCPVRQRALVERLVVNGQAAADVAELSRDPKARPKLREFEHGFEITLCRRPVTLTKRVTQRGRAIHAEYTLHNGTSQEQRVELQITSEWVPSYLAILLYGRRSLEITDRGARNVLTGAAVELTFEDRGDVAQALSTVHRTVTEAQLGILDQRIIRFDVAPGDTRIWRGLLSVEPGTDHREIDSSTQEWQTWCGQSL